MEILAQLRGQHGPKISGMIERGVRLMHEQATLDEDLKALAADTKEDFDVKPAEFMKVVKVVFDQETLEKKRQEVGDLTAASEMHSQIQSGSHPSLEPEGYADGLPG